MCILNIFKKKSSLNYILKVVNIIFLRKLLVQKYKEKKWLQLSKLMHYRRYNLTPF
jgi:hypothetical protein